ncbi:hypothetical protein [Staphylococcus simiae]|uniref:Uncharacterized protein n=1 Tax=Staphylococcus simiae CCM 7213 = CCUG 51256 TaxID=911238 RepID=G5JL57_9STAP|nr:hypothetical protein [Staphylococcus simiae]EHJ07075.1 hypothetical protein SS7213T_11110 [Staphylococcus simiae CCM 7213 = CCUG 51256]PNZ10029.1 hypothetical protein CD113_10980 [Staphylococcus simiae]SNV63893.1 membrane protein [Staphylococcus simiae]
MEQQDKRFEQLRFERKFVIIPYVIFAIIILALNIFYTDLKIMMTLFGLFFAYNLVMLFMAFIKHFKRTLILMLILSIISGVAFFFLIYVFAINHM